MVVIIDVVGLQKVAVFFFKKLGPYFGEYGKRENRESRALLCSFDKE